MLGVARVVVIDDDDDMRDLVRAAFSNNPGLEVVGEAADGLAGADVVGQLQPDLVMLDMRMPGRGGLSAIPMIRSASPQSAILVMSALDPEHFGPVARLAGADAYLAKPARVAQLVEAANTALGRRGGPT